jgi:Zn-dependent protease
MYVTRRFTLPAHGAIEFLAGMAMMLAPAVFAFSAGGLIVSAALGAVLTGVGLSLSTSRRGEEIPWHRHFDSIFLVIVAGAALALALAGQRPAAIFLAAMVGVQAALNLATRYATT